LYTRAWILSNILEVPGSIFSSGRWGRGSREPNLKVLHMNIHEYSWSP
jgi:hypothetical protein